jgi:hypothetical protein
MSGYILPGRMKYFTKWDKILRCNDEDDIPILRRLADITNEQSFILYAQLRQTLSDRDINTIQYTEDCPDYPFLCENAMSNSYYFEDVVRIAAEVYRLQQIITAQVSDGMHTIVKEDVDQCVMALSMLSHLRQHNELKKWQTLTFLPKWISKNGILRSEKIIKQLFVYNIFISQYCVQFPPERSIEDAEECLAVITWLVKNSRDSVVPDIRIYKQWILAEIEYHTGISKGEAVHVQAALKNIETTLETPGFIPPVILKRHAIIKYSHENMTNHAVSPSNGRLRHPNPFPLNEIMTKYIPVFDWVNYAEKSTHIFTL